MAGSRAGKVKETVRAKGNIILLAVCLLFYLLFPLCDGPVICVDSAGYIAMDISREPLYPTFLAFTRALNDMLRGPEEQSFMIAVILQSMLAGFTTWYTGLVVKKAKQQSTILQVLAIFFQFAVSLLCRFAAARGSVYTDCIMTEGLGLSLFVLFILELYLYVDSNRKCHLAWTLFLSFLLISLRKQMMITLPIMGAVFGWYYLIQGRKFKKFLCLAAMVIAVLAAGKLADRTYNYIVRGAWIEHCNNSMGILCTFLYSSNVEKDKELFEDAVVRDLYLEIMRQADGQELLYAYAQPGWLSVSEHFANSYDAIGYDIINPVVNGYIEEQYDFGEEEAAMQEAHAVVVATALKYDEICGEMSRTLFRQSPMPMFRVYVYNTWSGLINSIARASHVLAYYALAAYLGLGLAAAYLVFRMKKSGNRMKEDMAQQIRRSLSFAFIVMLAIIINALVVGLTIFTQPRYMIYGMGLFYTAGCMLLYDIIRLRTIN